MTCEGLRGIYLVFVFSFPKHTTSRLCSVDVPVVSGASWRVSALISLRTASVVNSNNLYEPALFRWHIELKRLVRNGLFIDVNRDADYAPTWMRTWTAVVTGVCRCFILLLSPRAGRTLHCSCRAHGCLMIPCRSLSNSQMWKHFFFHKPFVCYCLVDISVFGTFLCSFRFLFKKMFHLEVLATLFLLNF